MFRFMRRTTPKIKFIYKKLRILFTVIFLAVSAIAWSVLTDTRAGVVRKFWFQKTTNDRKFEVNGYKSVGTDSPLGEGLEGAQVNDIVAFNIRDDEIRVQIIDMNHAQE